MKIRPYTIWDLNDTARNCTIVAENGAAAVDIWLSRSGETLLEYYGPWKFRTDRTKYFICKEKKKHAPTSY